MALEKPSQSVTSQAVLNINVEPAQVHSWDGGGLLGVAHGRMTATSYRLVNTGYHYLGRWSDCG